MRDKILVGIDGVDKMLNGGIPEFNQVVLAGGPGAGKTLFGFEFLYKGAKNGEVGLFFSLEEHPDMVIENAKEAFSDYTDIDELISNKKLIIYDTADIRAYIKDSKDGPRYSFGKLMSDIDTAITATGATRLVFDSLSVIKLLISDSLDYRNISMDLITAFRNMGITALFTVEIEAAEKNRLFFQPEFFIYDGIITMYSGSNEGSNRTLTLEIIKMRGANHSRSTVPYEITPSGINVLLLAQRGDRNGT